MQLVQLERELELDWSNVRALRGAVGDALSEFPEEVRSAAVMTASELLENAIKYGERLPVAPSVRFTLSADDLAVEISVVNGTTVPDYVRDLETCIAEVQAADDKAALYVSKLESLLDASPEESAGLGIYRIGLEGQFDLRCSYDNQVVSVFATRKLQ